MPWQRTPKKRVCFSYRQHLVAANALAAMCCLLPLCCCMFIFLAAHCVCFITMHQLSCPPRHQADHIMTAQVVIECEYCIRLCAFCCEYSAHAHLVQLSPAPSPGMCLSLCGCCAPQLRPRHLLLSSPLHFEPSWAQPAESGGQPPLHVLLKQFVYCHQHVTTCCHRCGSQHQ
jgi:hypothetical protein